jgi:glucuronosyltransferase
LKPNYSLSPYSYVPHPFLSFTDEMSFFERIINALNFHVERLYFHFIHLPRQRELYKKYFPNAKRTFNEMYKNSSLLFMNQHVSSTSARPLLPNMIEIGGIHVGPAKKLPNDVQSFLDKAEEGVILFSMGSIVQAVNWPVEKREALVKVFAKLKQKVIWKYENETLPNKPGNVVISKWISQRDILAHPNVKVFITHGGLLGTTEALYEGVPVLGFPLFGDQRMNIAKFVERGNGLKIDFESITEDSVSTALEELLNNPKYHNTAKLISNRFKDRPLTPQQTVVFWVEYLARHQGAPYLIGHGNQLSLIELHLIDVYIFVTMMSFLISVFILKAIKALLGVKKSKSCVSENKKKV